MSWQSYVDDQLLNTKMVTHAVICGHDGNIWATSNNFGITPDELRALISKYNNTDQLAQSGVTIAQKKYMYLSSTEKVIRAKKGTSGVHAIKTTQSKNQIHNEYKHYENMSYPYIHTTEFRSLKGSVNRSTFQYFKAAIQTTYQFK